jgi:hypothetical protein
MDKLAEIADILLVDKAVRAREKLVQKQSHPLVGIITAS